MKKGTVLWAAVLAVLFLSSSARLVFAQSAYSKSSVLDFINKPTRRIEGGMDQYNRKKELYEGALASTRTPSAQPYPQLRRTLQRITSYLRMMKSYAELMDRKKDQVELIYGDSVSIDSTDPRWTQVVLLMDRLQRQTDKFNATEQAFNAGLNEYNSEADSYGLKRTPADDIRNELDKKINGHIQENTTFREQLKAADNWAAHDPSKAAGVQELHNLIQQKDAIWNEYKRIGEGFKQSIANQKYLYIGPGIPKVTVIQEVNAKGDAMQPYIVQYKSLLEKLRPQPAKKEPSHRAFKK